MKVLSVASECAPVIKTGGLADVAGALPGALAGRGVDMRVLLPGYPKVMAQFDGAASVLDLPDLFGGAARVLDVTSGDMRLFLLDAAHLYDRDGSPYLSAAGTDWQDNPQRFAALCWVAALICNGALTDWAPDLLHGHDWQAGLAPYYLKSHFANPVPSVMTIHNMAFHGMASPDLIETLRLRREDFDTAGFEFWGKISALKAGLAYADRITTVSPTYAQELATPAFGAGLDGLIRVRSDVVSGILNGIDTNVWNPATDPAIIKYSTYRGKARARKRLIREFGLPETDGPVAVVISRLSEQKGLDLLLQALPAFLDRGGSLALLGSGDQALERDWLDAQRRYRAVGVHIGYDEALSHRMIAGGDAILVPSRFEPCGLTQLYGLRYGTIPVVAHTGGLADTIIDANDAALSAGVATGLQHQMGSVHAIACELDKLVTLYADRDTWRTLMRNAMRHPVGWDASAAQYVNLYRSLVSSS